MQALFEVRRYRRRAETHRHDFHQLVLPLEGRLSMHIGQSRGAVSSRSLALIAAGQAHSFTGSESNAFLVLDLPVDAPTVTDGPGVLIWKRALQQPFVTLDADLRHLIRYLANASDHGKLAGAQASHGCALLLGALSMQLGLDVQGSRPSGLRAICGYVDAHLEWPLDVAELAGVGHVSTSRLHAWFREHLHTTPQQYVTRRRLQRADELLTGTSLSVMEVAWRVGYADQGAFARAFRRHTGKTPLQWRAAKAGSQDRHKSQ